MITPKIYEAVRKAEDNIRKAGFDLEVREGTFLLTPARGTAGALAAGRLGGLATKVFSNLEDAFSYLEGWKALDQLLAKKAGFTTTEIKERVEQQRVMDTLKGKRTNLNKGDR